MIRLLYKPVSMPVSVAGGMLAGVIFKRVWKIIAGEDAAPPKTRKLTGVWPGHDGQLSDQEA